jgi:hypothetical protein
MPDDPFLVSLLFEQEGATLDFKRDQYRFYGTPDTDKAELLKDILAFVNAWRRTDAYILIGVDENPGSNAVVIGVTDHLKDADIQQFVNSKTNAPAEFIYTSAELEGKSIGVIRIPVQERPRSLLKAFGGLQAKTVYLRRGSSTDIAGPDEIIRMAAPTPFARPELTVVFADAMNRQVIGETVDLNCTFVEIEGASDLPDYEESSSPYLPSTLYQVNRDYFRDLASFIVAGDLARPIQFAIRNASSTSALDVRVELFVRSSSALLFDHDSWPDEPEARNYGLLTGGMARLTHDPPLDVAVKRLADAWVIDLFAEKVQPHSTAWLKDKLYIGSKATEELRLEGKISADNLAAPQSVSLVAKCTTDHQPMSLETLFAIAVEHRGR